MIDILIEATHTTPYVKIDSDAGSIQFSGKSSPENSLTFYHPIIDKIKNLFSDKDGEINVDMSFRYFNTSSSKCLFDLFKALKGLMEEGKDININWYYEDDDEDMMETGEDFADLLDIEFNLIPVDDITEMPLRAAV